MRVHVHVFMICTAAEYLVNTSKIERISNTKLTSEMINSYFGSPSGCYLRDRQLYFNVAPLSSITCSSSQKCLCRGAAPSSPACFGHKRHARICARACMHARTSNACTHMHVRAHTHHTHLPTSRQRNLIPRYPRHRPYPVSRPVYRAGH